jgi:hypothetical protein
MAYTNPPPTIAQNQGSKNPQTATLGNVEALQAPAIAGTGLSLTGILGQMGLVGEGVQQQTASQLQGEQLSAAQLGLQQQGNTLQQQLLAKQLGLAPVQQGVEEEQYGYGQAQLANQIGLQQYLYPLQQQQQESAAAAQGSVNTIGQREAMGTLAEQEKVSLGNLLLQQQSAQAGQRGEEAGYQYSLSALANQQQQLQLAAQANGLSVQQLENQTNAALNQIQLGGASAADQLLTQEGGQLQTLGQEVGTVGAQATGLGINVSPGQLASSLLKNTGIDLGKAYAGYGG